MGLASKLRVSCSPAFYAVWAVLVLLVPVRWLVAWLTAAFCHECFHCLAVILTGKRILNIRITSFGAEIQTDPLEPAQSLFCALSGPLSGFVLLIFAKFIPRIALCAFAQSICNLLPVGTLDGSIAMRSALALIFPEETAQRICSHLELVMIVFLILMCGYGAWRWRIGNLPLLFAAVLLLRYRRRKIPCKYGLYRVQ